MEKNTALSMTGFGAGEAPLGSGVVRVELRAVNHRHLDIRVRASADLAEHNALVEELLRAGAARGRVEALVRWDAAHAFATSLDFARARQIYKQLQELRDELAPGEPLPFTAVLSVPGVLGASVRLDTGEIETALRRATAGALEQLSGMREREGRVLVADLQERLQLFQAHAGQVTTQRSLMLDAVRQRLVRRVEKLLEGTGLEPDPARLTQEIAWFAERSDIAEELTRLGSHIQEFARSLESTKDGVGKKLDFLVQEMGREVNTIGSKANDAGIAHKVVEMKAELERIREQVQNLL